MTQRADKDSKTPVGHVEGGQSAAQKVVIHHEGRDPSSPARVDRTPKVIDDQGPIEECHQKFERRLDELYSETFAAIHAGDWVFFNPAFKLRRQRAIADLQKLISHPATSAATKAKAAESMIELKEKAGEILLLQMLDSKSADDRVAALKSLGEWSVRIDLSTPERSKQILRQLADSDPRVVLAAARLCNYHEVPGCELPLTELLEKRKASEPEKIAAALAAVATTPRAVHALLPYVLKPEAKEFQQFTGFALDKLVRSPNPAISEPVKRALYDYAFQFKNQRYDQSLVRHLADCADNSAIPVLEDIVRHAKDGISRLYATEGLARLQPDRALEIMLQFYQREGGRPHIVSSIRKYSSEKDFDRIIAVLLGGAKQPARKFDEEFVRLCFTELKDKGRKFIEEHMDDLDDDARMHATWKLKGIDVRKALAELHSLRVISTEPEALLRKMRETPNEFEEQKEFDPSDPHLLTVALAADGIVVAFDAETGEIPCRHDYLVLDFADATHGRFTPQWPVEIFHQSNADDFDGPYTLEFVLGKRLFRTGAENNGDWYDVEAVVNLINYSLKTTGRPERFLALASDGQIASFVFADPGVFVPIAQKYQLPLSEDSNQAMQKGIEFEKQVFEQLKK